MSSECFEEGYRAILVGGGASLDLFSDGHWSCSGCRVVCALSLLWGICTILSNNWNKLAYGLRFLLLHLRRIRPDLGAWAAVPLNRERFPPVGPHKNGYQQKT